MSCGLFVTGTDTGVGKTIVTAALAIALRRRGLCVGVMKPAESGCPLEQGQLSPQDALFLKEMSGCAAPLTLINPYRLAQALTPALAAEHEGVVIDLDHIRDCYDQLAAMHDIVLVEGAGGLLAPLIDRSSMRDLAVRLELPLLVVARNVLGVINHTALTVTVARQTSAVLGVVLNNSVPIEQAAEQSNAAALRRWGGAPLLGQIPYSAALSRDYIELLGAELDVAAILQAVPASKNSER
ncbi:MAG: dethiobiotin synthase [Chloroflexales bacterium]|nr:dethiobiotin synthase [Chloroflexales bacterium]